MQTTQSKSFLHRTRDVAYNLFYDTGLSNLFYQMRGRKRGMITYHNVLEKENRPQGGRYAQDMTLEVMEYHLDFLSRNFGILPYSQLDNQAAKGFFISFDDGMLNNYTLLLPLLEKYKVQALFAVCPDGASHRIPYIWRDHIYLILKSLVGKSVLLPFNNYHEALPVTQATIDSLNAQVKEWVYANQVSNLYGMVREICTKNKVPYRTQNHHPARFHFMNWDQVADLHQRGHIIASHTLSHRIMRFLPEEEKWLELKNSREEIQDHLHAPVDYIAYPYGGEQEIDRETLNLAEKAGYKSGFMNVQHHTYGNHPHAMPRFGLPHSQSEPQLHATVSGLTSFLKGKAV